MVILCVDDDQEDLEIFRDALKEALPEAKCLTASSGRHALEILNSDVLPDFIFMDINMSMMTGSETLSKIRDNKKLAGVSVIMCSTTANPVEIDRCRALGANDFLIKPSSYSLLCEALKKIITGS
jgi:CheY-like chemotaxis protein